MLVEAITTATFSNGILRLEVATINGRGEQVVSGNIEIPGNQVSNVLASISTAAQDISKQLSSNDKSNGGDNKSSSSGKKNKDSSKKK
tara:strand:- start:101 stop:364 length:264 start_codon:yes stop_codon:yes gene_type:complete